MRVRVRGYSVVDDSSIPSLEQKAKSSPSVKECILLLLPTVPGHSRGQLLHLGLCGAVPTAQGLRCKREEGNTLLLALLGCHPHFAIICIGECRARGCGCPSNSGGLEGVYHGDIKCCISAPR